MTMKPGPARNSAFHAATFSMSLAERTTPTGTRPAIPLYLTLVVLFQ